MKMEPDVKDISGEVFGRYVTGFVFAGFEWSDLDEYYGIFDSRPKIGSLSAPGKVRVRYIPGFRFWQLLGIIPKGPWKD